MIIGGRQEEGGERKGSLGRYIVTAVAVIVAFFLGTVSRSCDDIYLDVIQSKRDAQLQSMDLENPDMFTNREAETVLITGGMGFVGRHFTHRFCSMGWNVLVIDNMVSESAMYHENWPEHLKCKNAAGFKFVKMDVRDFFKSKMSQRKFDVFIHLAAVVGGRATIEGNPLSVADDLSIDSVAFQWAIDTKTKVMPKRMIYFSSSAVYPVKLQQDSSEAVHLVEQMINLDDPNVDIAKPDLTYGWAKLTGEYLAKLAQEKYGLKVAVYRPMSGYGEDQSDVYPTKAIVRKGMKKLNPLPIWSDAVRDLIYIEDVVDCVLLTMQNDQPFVLNLGTGIATSFSQLAKLVGRLMGYQPKVVVQEGMPLGVANRVGGMDKLEESGCHPSTSVEQGIRLIIDFELGKQLADPSVGRVMKIKNWIK